jgi:hypothetical protein
LIAAAKGGSPVALRHRALSRLTDRARACGRFLCSPFFSYWQSQLHTFDRLHLLPNCNDFPFNCAARCLLDDDWRNPPIV